MTNIRALRAPLAFALCLLAAGSSPNRAMLSAVESSQDPGSYPYGSAAFHRFVVDSYRAAGRTDARSFHAWMDRAARKPGQPVRSSQSNAWTAEMDARRLKRARLRSARECAAAELREAADLHRWEKRAIPRFSLDRGYEFTAVVAQGERQCLLQSVLLAALLQRSGIRAGAVMVFRNGDGEESNLGHVVTLVKLADGNDVLVDASHREPFVRQTGLFARIRGGGYRFVRPVFVPGSSRIASYRLVASGAVVPASRVQGLDTAYLGSQFAYYRGERTPRGVLSARPTPAGLRAQARWLKESLARCPANPLSTYLLSWVDLRAGRASESYRLAERAARLYRAAGWMPDGPRDVLARSRSAVRCTLARTSSPTRPGGSDPVAPG